MLELAILGLLKDDPLHGYELKKRLGVLWGVSYGSLYPALRRLEKSGAIKEVGPAEAASPTGAELPGGAVPSTRKAYRITPSGDARFTELLDDDAGDDERGFALRLSFFRHLRVRDRLVVLARRRADLSARLDKARRDGEPDGLDRYTRSLVEHRTRSISRDLEWVDELIDAEHTPAHEEGAPT